MEEKHQQSVSDEKVTASVSKEPAKDENPTIILKGPDGVAKKRHGLKLATDRVKSCGELRHVRLRPMAPCFHL